MKTPLNLFRKQENALNRNVVSDDMELDEMYRRPTIYTEIKHQQQKRAFFMRVSMLLIILNLLLIANAFSQLLVAKNANVTNTTQITVKGDVLFTNGTVFNNNGTFELQGDFINDSGNNLFGISAGTTILNGSNQAIAGNSITAFNNLQLYGPGTKTLLQDVITGGNNGLNTGILALESAQLDLNSHELTLNNFTAGAITRTTGFVVSETDALAGYGKINWLVKNNTGNYIFPFGNAATNHYIPVGFEIAVAGTGPNGQISVATYPTVTTATPNNRPLPAGLNSLVSIAGIENAHNTLDRWWMMDVSGYIDNPASSLTLTYRDSEWDASAGSTNLITENLLQAQSHNGTVWDLFTSGAVNTSANTVTITGINNYNPYWTLVGSNNPLPVQLLVFDVKLNASLEAELNWITATEVNNDYFTIERSHNGFNFEPIGVVDGAGNSSGSISYNYLDKKPLMGISYYRLKQTDFDGQYSYSEIKSVRIEKPVSGEFFVYPNPVNDHFYINFGGEIISEKIVISDMKGKIVREIAIEHSELSGSNELKVERNNLAPGVYVISIPGKKSVRMVMN